jgi:ribose-phosphate pyrophosphokinase
MTLFTGSANPLLARAVSDQLRWPLAACRLERFPDGELHIEVHETVRARRVFILQPTSPPVETHLFEILMLADACRRAGARECIAVMPYFGYARQDRRATGREPIGARIAADALGRGGIDRVVVLDLHSRATEGFFGMPPEHLSATGLLVKAIQQDARNQGVIVAPDLGAVPMANRYSQFLELPVATVFKTRISGTEVKVQQLVGDVRDRRPFIVDDMISTGGTVAAAVRALLAAGCRPDITVVATHGVFTPEAAETLQGLPVGRVMTTDTVTPKAGLPLPIEIVSVAPLLADAITRLDKDESLGDLILHG